MNADEGDHSIIEKRCNKDSEQLWAVHVWILSWSDYKPLLPWPRKITLSSACLNIDRARRACVITNHCHHDHQALLPLSLMPWTRPLRRNWPHQIPGLVVALKLCTRSWCRCITLSRNSYHTERFVLAQQTLLHDFFGCMLRVTGSNPRIWGLWQQGPHKLRAVAGRETTCPLLYTCNQFINQCSIVFTLAADSMLVCNCTCFCVTCTTSTLFWASAQYRELLHDSGCSIFTRMF